MGVATPASPAAGFANAARISSHVSCARSLHCSAGCAIFCAGFADGTTKEDFEGAFSSHGEIAKVFIRDNRDKNYAFVTFTAPEAAEAAIAAGATINGNECTVELQVKHPICRCCCHN